MGIHITHRNRKVRLVGTGMAAQLHRLGEGDLNGSKILGIDVRKFTLIYSIKRRPPQLFPAGRERKRRTLSGASSRSRPVKISFMAAGGSLLTQEAGHHDAEANS